MKPPYQERHFDYVLGPNQDSRLASVAPGQVISGITLQLRHDAPFILRGRAYRVQYESATVRQQELNGLSLRYSGPLRDFRQQTYIPQNLVMPYGGQGGAWKGLRHPVAYPAGGVIQVDLVNTTANTTFTNLTMYWRGVELYPWGINPSYTYQPGGRTLTFVYPINPITAANPFGIIQALQQTETRLLQQFKCGNDADFALRYVQAFGNFRGSVGPPVEMFFVLRDENQKAFSNDFVHWETLFGPSAGFGAKSSIYPCGGTQVKAIGTGNVLPSVFYPEIYVPRNHVLWYDVKRTDGGISGAPGNEDIPVNLVGSKVYSS